MQFYWRGPLNLSLAWYNDVRNILPSKEVAHFKDPVLAIAGADHTFNIFTGDMSKFNEIMPVTTEWFLKKLGNQKHLHVCLCPAKASIRRAVSAARRLHTVRPRLAHLDYWILFYI